MLYSIQAYRGIAVLLIVFFHGSRRVLDEYGVDPFFGIFNFGFSGVHLFFVLSGFIILTAHVKDIGVPKQISWYVKRRVIRIYPIYWVVLFLLGGWKLISINMDIKDFCLNAFLFMADKKLVLPVSWTMHYELIFYVIFASLIFNKKLGITVIAVWVFAILLNWTNYLPWGHSASAIFHHLNLLFIFGMLAAILRLKLMDINSDISSAFLKISFFLGVILFILTSIYWSSLNLSLALWPQPPVLIIGFGLTTGFLVLSSASPEIDGAFKRQKILRLIGDASYSIYLVHLWGQKESFNIIRSWTRRATGVSVDDGMGQSVLISSVFLAIICVAPILFGILVYLKVERPLLLFFRKKISR